MAICRLPDADSSTRNLHALLQPLLLEMARTNVLPLLLLEDISGVTSIDELFSTCTKENTPEVCIIASDKNQSCLLIL